MEKLISMTDFVLENTTDILDYGYNANEVKTNKYANFLKQPLMIGMFVPCDLDGNVLTKNTMSEDTCEDDCDHYNCVKEMNQCISYQEAKSRVFFDVYDIKEHHAPHLIQIWHDKEKYLFSYNISSKLFSTTANTIEDLVKNNLVLTESAKKQIGI